MRYLTIILALALLGFSPPPVSLGADDLELGYRLYVSDDGETWEEYDFGEDDPPEFSGLGSGDYSIAGLPDATGTQEYQLIAYLNGAEDAAIASISWGVRQTRIAAQLVYDRPTSGPFKVGDTFGVVQMVVRSGLTDDIEDATVTVAMKRQGAADPVFTGRAGTVTSIVDHSNGSKGATFTYDVQAGDFTRSGRYRLEFSVTYDGGGGETLPKTVGGVQIEVIDTI